MGCLVSLRAGTRGLGKLESFLVQPGQSQAHPGSLPRCDRSVLTIIGACLLCQPIPVRLGGRP